MLWRSTNSFTSHLPVLDTTSRFSLSTYGKPVNLIEQTKTENFIVNVRVRFIIHTVLKEVNLLAWVLCRSLVGMSKCKKTMCILINFVLELWPDWPIWIGGAGSQVMYIWVERERGGCTKFSPHGFLCFVFYHRRLPIKVCYMLCSCTPPCMCDGFSLHLTLQWMLCHLCHSLMCGKVRFEFSALNILAL